ncbi:MAG: AgmX/PglI C-terminal domain-containing protein [Gammaproteobacteria bacterium]|jgi:outer membrane biosynthesis protein TonB
MSTAVAHDEQDIHLQLDRCYARIAEYQEVIKRLEADLATVDGELDSIADERQQYEVLSGVCENLEKLNEIGGNDLFWSGLVNEGQVDDQLKRLRDQVDFFERRIRKVTDRRDGIAEEIKNNNFQIALLEDEIDYLKERQEESKHEYIVEREIKPVPYRVVVMPWTKKGEDEKRYRKILLLALLLSILLGLLIPLYDVPIPDRNEVQEIPERLAKLIKKQQPKPKPKPKIKQEKKKPDEKKKEPTKKERKEAREKVKSKGVLAFKNNFADLLDDASLDKLGADANLSNAGSTAKNTRRSIITSQAKSSSGGISSSALSQNVAGTGDDIEAVAFSRVESEIGTAVADDRPLSDGPGPSRTDEEIQIVFDKYKAALYRIYNRELRKNPTLQGKVVLRITIEPDGSVSLAKVESTDMDAKNMLAKIVARVKRFNFGAKEGVPQVTILYPIDFLPAS